MAQTPVAETNDNDVMALEALCERLVGFDEMVNLEWLDGYMAALAAGPRRVALDEWLPVFADGLFDRVFADPADAAEASRLLGKRYAELCWQLDPESILDKPEELRIDPLMYKFSDDGEDGDAEGAPADVTDAIEVTDITPSADAPAPAAPAATTDVAETVADEVADEVVDADGASAEDDTDVPADWPGDGVYWSIGFIDAIADFADDWKEPDEDAEDAETYNDLLESIALLAETDSEARTETMHRLFDGVDMGRDELINEALFAAQELRIYWINHAPKAPTRRVGPTPGRNDPCSCGSGKKYKKCCGANA